MKSLIRARVAMVLLAACAIGSPLRAQSTEPTSPIPNATEPAATGHAMGAVPGFSREAGSVTLPNGWSIKPAGRQLSLSTLPVNIAIHPTGRYIVALTSGMRDHELTVVNTTTNKVVARVVIETSFYGLAFSPDGTKLYASGSENEKVFEYPFSVDDGLISSPRKIAIAEAKKDFVPAGLSVSADGKTLFVAGLLGHGVAVVDLAAADPSASESKKILSTGPQSFPYTVVVDPSGKKILVSLWGKSSVAIFDRDNLDVAPVILPTGSHPTEMTFSKDGKTLYVACSDTTSVSVFDFETRKPLETIACTLHPLAPSGNTPASLSLSPDGQTLYVANANANNVAVIDVSERSKARPRGFIPVGWYPTAVRVSDKGTIYVTNGKGGSSLPNPSGPQPGSKKQGDPTVDHYIGRLLPGSLSIINPPNDAALARLTKQSYDNCPLRADLAPRIKPEPGNPIPAKVGDPSPIKYCFYVIKENRTYDQVFGDLPQGNGDPNLCLFPRRVTPNLHKLVEEFVLLDNTYVESEVSAQGHEWTTAAIATDFVEKLWPQNYRSDGYDKIKYPAEAKYDSIARPSSGYIWDNCAKHGVSYFTFGEWVNDGPTPDSPAVAAVPAIEGHFDPLYRPYDLKYPDIKRHERFAEKFKEWEAAGEMPRFQIVRLGNDHTAGSKEGMPTPAAMVADNDLAVGRLIETISHSKFWKESAIFIIEDDAQNGPDHVDAHRTTALVISPYTKRKYVDSTMYSTSSLLRTMELILGLPPMTPFDAAAAPMYASFTEKPDFTPYKSVIPEQPLDEMNVAGMFGQDFMATADLGKEDALDDILFNEIIWKAVKGRDSEMPRPVRAAFVRPIADADDDDHDEAELVKKVQAQLEEALKRLAK